MIEFLADERIGVTISIDGPQEIQDKFRVFNNGKGSYDVAAPKIKALLARHTVAADRRARHADAADARRDARSTGTSPTRWASGKSASRR